MPSENIPFRFTAGGRANQLLSADHLNSTADQLVDLRREVNRHLTFPPPNMDFVGWAWANVKDDSDFRYTPIYKLTLQRLQSGLAKDTAIVPEDDTLYPTEQREITATNLWEIQTQSHLCAVGATVHVWMFRDPNTGREFNFFSAPPSGSHFAVKVRKKSGSQGTLSTPASWVYTVNNLAGYELADDVALTRLRPTGRASFYTTGGTATWTATDPADWGPGVAYYDDTTLKLWDAGEIYPIGSCPT